MNYLIFNGKEPTQKQLILGYLMAGLPLLFGFYMAVWGFGQIADKKAENPDNLIKGCMYYYGYRKDKHNSKFFYFLIENKLYVHTYLFRNNFFSNIEKNQSLSRGDFYDYVVQDMKKCHTVSYIKLDFILFQKVFVYEYYSENNYQP